jgi:hypothetical protein
MYAGLYVCSSDFLQLLGDKSAENAMMIMPS